MSTMRKIRRASHLPRHRVEPFRHSQPPPERKMSEVLEDFAEPVLETLREDQFKAGISIAALCWNLSFLPRKEQHAQIDSSLDKLRKSDPLMRLEFEGCISMLLERKKAFFADDRRMILNYEFIEEEGRPRLLVASTLAND